MLTKNETPIWSVSSLNASARDLLEGHFRSIFVEGEISNFSKPNSGHYYFTLKDEIAQIRCAMFRGRNRCLNFEPKDGMHVLACASVSLYEPRGDYQLIVESLTEHGTGALQRQFEMLKAKLQKEGLFEETHKKTLPAVPHKVGIITSPTGAAIRDILSVLKRRFPLLEIIIYPTQVQGNQAAQQIVQALKLAETQKECDALILARGGGSLEDLWPFNDEQVARQIFACQIPIISGVGHEVDFTIADFVADVRAPTPSAAAELISPKAEIWLKQFIDYQERLTQHLKNSLFQKHQHFIHLKSRLRHPKEKIYAQMQTVDFIEQRLRHLIIAQFQKKEQELKTLGHCIEKYPLKNNIHQKQMALLQAHSKIQTSILNKIQMIKEQFNLNIGQLNALSPLATLERGYSITLSSQNKIISSITTIKPGEVLTTQLRDGIVKSHVKSIVLP